MLQYACQLRPGDLPKLHVAETIAMSWNVETPRVVITRPKSATAFRSYPPISIARNPGHNGRTPLVPTPHPVPQATLMCPRPSRPLSSPGKRPSSAVGSRRRYEDMNFAVFSAATSRSSWEDNTIINRDLFVRRSEQPPAALSLESEGNIYHAVAARKEAEDVAKQLERRIAYFCTQEERVLRDIQTMRSHLETTIAIPQENPKSLGLTQGRPLTGISAPCIPLRPRSRSTIPVDRGICHDSSQPLPLPKSETKRKLKVPRSRDQLQFLTKQKQILETHKRDAARQQKERLKAALAGQKAKEAEQERKRRALKERIRAEEQQTLEQRTAKQRQLREAMEKQHHERLMAERQRQREVLRRIEDMQEEERNLGLRLEALRFHQGHIKQGLQDTSSQLNC